MKLVKWLGFGICILLICFGIYGYVQVKKAWTQKLELKTADALAHAYKRTNLREWMKTLDLSDSEDKIVFARSVHALMMAGEEFIVAYPSNTFDLTKVRVLDTEENYILRTPIPDLELIGTKYDLTPKKGDGGYTEIIRTSQYDVIFIYGGDG